MMSRDSDSRRTLVDLAAPDIPLSPQSMADRRRTLASEAEGGIAPPGRPGNDRHRSVFGVDTVWQREMAKLRKEEEAERAADKQVNSKRAAGLPTAEDFELDGALPQTYEDDQDEDLHHIPLLDGSSVVATPLPVLPPIPSANDMSSRRAQPVDIDDWGASDDENPKPARRTKRNRAANRLPHQAQASRNDSSDEDLPLTKAFKINKRPVASKLDESSSEDEPLAKILVCMLPIACLPLQSLTDIDLQAKKQPPVLPTIPVVSAPSSSDGEEEDDDVPLALRRMTMMNLQSGSGDKPDEDDDDIPLAQKHLSAAHAQAQRQSAMFPHQQQQHQQQLLYQQQAMFANPMAGGFGMPPMAMPMMGMPMMSPYMGMNPSMMSIPQMQPPQDPAIDRWRREVELKEGSVIGSVQSGRT